MDMAWIKSHMKGTEGAVSDRFEALGNLVDTTLESVQENVARHARASRVEVGMAQDRGCFTISISDNGRGIPSQELSGPMSLGIAGMRERAELIMGRFDIQSRMGKGTRVTVYLPVSP